MRAFPLVLIAALAASPADAAGWLRYCNDRFGQCADIPAGYRSDPPPDNSDGLVFRDGAGMSITVSAMYNALDSTVASERRSDVETLGAPAYEARGSNWFVISGVKGDAVYYVKTFVKPSTISSVWIEYPAARKADYDKVVAHVVKSFTPAP
jgi:hypothetical protein